MGIVSPAQSMKAISAGLVFLPHDDVEFAAPAVAQFSEVAVAIARRVRCKVLFPQQLQPDAPVAAQLIVNRGEIRLRPLRLCVPLRVCTQGSFEAAAIPAFG